MLRITVDIVPVGDEARKHTIAEITAGLRKDSDMPAQGNYNVVIKEERFNRGNPALLETDSFVIKEHWRGEGALKLVQLILQRMQGLALPSPTETKARELKQLAKKQGYNIREDGRVERICEHGVGHTIGHIDAAKEDEPYMFTHGCCSGGCCRQYKRLSEEGATNE